MRLQIAEGVVLITGAAQGIGARIAERAAEAGAQALMLTDRQPDKGAAVAAELADAGVETAFVAANLAEPDAPARIIEATLERFGRVDHLVNAAGITDRASFIDGTTDDWTRIFAINARAPFFLMQGVINDLRRREAPGAIVNIVSMNAHCGAPELAIYSAAKGALATMTKNAANAHLADRIRVNGINVGWVPTPAEQQMQAETLAKGAAWAEQAAAAKPLGRMLTTDEVACVAVFLLSDGAGLMTGGLLDLEQWVAGAAP